jgi:hypothetical protein
VYFIRYKTQVSQKFWIRQLGRRLQINISSIAIISHLYAGHPIVPFPQAPLP